MMPGKLVRLRPKTRDDVVLDYTWQTDAELAQLDACPKLPMDFCEYSREYEMALRRGSQRRQMYAVETDDGRHIGNCVYHENETGEDITEIGIMIGERDDWDRGYGTDAIRVILRFAFEVLKLRRVELITDADNERGIRAYEKCGFVREGVLRAKRLRYGEPLDMIIMAVLRED